MMISSEVSVNLLSVGKSSHPRQKQTLPFHRIEGEALMKDIRRGKKGRRFNQLSALENRL